jgi:hypothetical protein
MQHSTDVHIEQSTRSVLDTPIGNESRRICIDLSEYVDYRLTVLFVCRSGEQSSDVSATLIYYRVCDMFNEQVDIACLFRHVSPTSHWYAMDIRDGDRLLAINDRNIRYMTSNEIRSLLNKHTTALTCEIIWHPELYINLGQSTFIDLFFRCFLSTIIRLL